MTPQEIRQFAERLRAQAKAAFEDGTFGSGIIGKAIDNTARDVAEWYTAQLQVLADQRAKAAATDIEELDDMLVVRHLNPRHEGETLRQAIDRIINWEVAVNLDPLVSSAARDLIERGRREASTPEPDQALVTEAIRNAVRREADAWRQVVEVERRHVASVEGRYWALVERLASLSMVSMPAPQARVADEFTGLYTHSAASRMAVEARREAFREAAAFLRQWGVSGAPVDAIERKAKEMDP